MTFEVYTVQENSKNAYGSKNGDIRVKFPEIGKEYEFRIVQRVK